VEEGDSPTFLPSTKGIKMKTQMKSSSKAIALIMSDEGDKLQSYPDEGGVWTVGYGHTGVDVGPNMVITQNQASNLLAMDIVHKAELPINRLVTVDLNQNQFDALTSFVFNEGEGHFAQSEMLRLINLGYFTSAAPQFLRWIYIKGAKSTGLLKRRQQEMALFMTPMEG
jgi:lysozyme